MWGWFSNGLGMIFSIGHILVKTISGPINADTYINLMKDTASLLMRDILHMISFCNKTTAVLMFQKKVGLFRGDGN